MSNIKFQFLFCLKTALFFLILIVVGFAFFLIPPLAQDISYHHFADHRYFLHTPNFLNVTSNLFFLIIALLGLFLLARKKFSLQTQGERILTLLFFIALFFVGIGSAYYHAEPTHFTLLFDRFPIAVAFSAFFSLLLSTRIHSKLGLLLAPFLIFASLITVLYWYYSELTGFGDLRPYILSQAIPLLALPLICLLFPSKRFKDRYLLLSFICYLLALSFELFDNKLFLLTKQHLSGHTIKHLFGALASLFLLFYLRQTKKE